MTLEDWGWDPEVWAGAVDAAREQYGQIEIARVAADFGVEHRVVGDFGDERASLAGKLRFGGGVRPAVGDFVVLVGAPGSYSVVDVLPRRSWLARQAAGKKTGAQTIAANLDLVFVVTSFNEDFSFNRIERYLTAIRDGGARGVVVVNKLDLVDRDQSEALLADLRARLGDVPLIATSATRADGLDALHAHLASRSTASFVGSSGVGKSTLVNALLGEQRQVVAEIREEDAKGRHTTTHREIFVLPGGALVIDTPGMREFQLWDEGGGLEAFADIEQLGAHCRFRDCTHAEEPGCAVNAAVASGELAPDRLESWRKLAREAEYQRARVDDALRREREKEWAKRSVDIKRLYRQRDRGND